MPVQKQGYNIPFGQGLDTKTDPNQVQAGKMLALRNSVFNKGQLQKRDGFPLLTTLPDATSTTLTTLNGNLIATGTELFTFSADTKVWIDSGIVQPVDLSVLSLVRNSNSQSSVDAIVASNGLVCTVYIQGTNSYYQISDSVTGQAIVAQTQLPATATNPRVFTLNRYFIILFGVTVAAAPHLQYIAIPINNPSSPSAATDITTDISAITAGYDAVEANNNLYIAWNGNDGGGAIRVIALTSTLILSSIFVQAGFVGDLISMVADISGPAANIFVSFWGSGTTDAFTMVLDENLQSVLTPTQIANNVAMLRITGTATDSIMKVYYEVDNDYSYSSVNTNYISTLTINTSGTVSGTTVLERSVGLASKAATASNGTDYILVTQSSAFQPTYFLIDGSGNVILKLAYSNGGGYNSTQVLSNLTVNGLMLQTPYLIKDLLVSVNKTQGATATGGVYTQTGINLATMSVNTTSQESSEIASALHLSGGFLWEFDSAKPVEHGFHLWPEDILATQSNSTGTLTIQQYFHVVTYEWTDAQGMLHRSAPSIPVGTNLTGANDTITLNIPTLRLTYKTAPNPVRIVVYRWSAAQQSYYQVTSVSSPLLNNPAVDSVVFVDTFPDSAILGNTLLYTTGGVLENIAAPALSDITLFKSRLFGIDAEDENLIWFSKQVISGTPVEMSDLLTLYIAPTIGAQGSTGGAKVISSMDDKFIIFKRDAIYYVTGTGPDNTGANNDFSDPVFITSTIGCTNPKSLVFQPGGIMFQSDKGIWLLGRDLSTTYVGAGVEAFNDVPITSALSVPGTNEVRFTLENGTVLMYDYYYQQWGTFGNIPGVSSTLYQGKHTYLNSAGQVFKQESGVFLDNSRPTLMSFSTAWLKLTDLQGFQRAYFFYFLGKFLSPHKLQVDISYDYDPAIMQSIVVTPDNTVNVYGSDPLYGGSSPFGGASLVEQFRVFLDRQKCQSIQISMTEIYNPALGQPAGAGFTMSGLNLVVGSKASYPKLPASKSA